MLTYLSPLDQRTSQTLVERCVNATPSYWMQSKINYSSLHNLIINIQVLQFIRGVCLSEKRRIRNHRKCYKTIYLFLKKVCSNYFFPPRYFNGRPLIHRRTCSVDVKPVKNSWYCITRRTVLGALDMCVAKETQQTQSNSITFIQRRPNVFDVGPTLCKRYKNGLCLL